MLSAGTNVEWLCDDLGLIADPAESHDVASRCADTDGVVYVPALLGLGTPRWDYGARGTLLGLTRGSGREHVVRAVLEGVAQRGADLVDAATADTGIDIHTLRVDGGMSRNPTFVQALADAADRPVEVSPVAESTTIGAAFLAGLGVGIWNDIHDLDGLWQPSHVVEPRPDNDHVRLRERWSDALDRCRRLVPRSLGPRLLNDHQMTTPRTLELLGCPPSGKAVGRMTPKGHSPVDLESAQTATSRRSLVGALGVAGLASAVALAVARPVAAAPHSPTAAGLRRTLEQALQIELAAKLLYRDALAAGLTDAAAEVAQVFGDNHEAYADQFAAITGISANTYDEAFYDEYKDSVRHERRRRVRSGRVGAGEQLRRHVHRSVHVARVRRSPRPSWPRSW